AADYGWYDIIYVSTNTTIAGAVSSQYIGVYYSGNAPLAPGGSYVETNTITLPEQSGTYYLIYEANTYFVNDDFYYYYYGYYSVYEADTNNNVLVSSPVTVTYD